MTQKFTEKEDRRELGWAVEAGIFLSLSLIAFLFIYFKVNP